MNQELYTWVAIYAPVQSERAERKTFFDQLDGFLRAVPHERLGIGGDWNGHMGNDTTQRGLPVRTTSGGLEVQQFLAQHNFLQVADHHYPIRNRGTWRHSLNKAWYELDYMLTTGDMIRRLQHARVQPYTYSDHMAKVLCFHLCPASKRQWAGQKFHTAAKYKQHPTTDYTAMRGPTPAARQIRQHMQQEMENRLRPWLRDLHLNQSPDLPTITIFVDGSFTGQPGTTQHHQAAGWGIHIPQLNISYHDKVITNNTHPMWVGATHLSNNTGELTAITFALMWAHFHVADHNICIAYDSSYAANCTQGTWAPTNNHSLVETAQHWLRLCQEKAHVSFRYVPAHTQQTDWWSINNEQADYLAKQGGYNNWINDDPRSHNFRSNSTKQGAHLRNNISINKPRPTNGPHNNGHADKEHNGSGTFAHNWTRP